LRMLRRGIVEITWIYTKRGVRYGPVVKKKLALKCLLLCALPWQSSRPASEKRKKSRKRDA